MAEILHFRIWILPKRDQKLKSHIIYRYLSKIKKWQNKITTDLVKV